MTTKRTAVERLVQEWKKGHEVLVITQGESLRAGIIWQAINDLEIAIAADQRAGAVARKGKG